MSTGEIRGDRCGAIKCRACGPRAAALHEKAVAHGGTTGSPSSWITLTWCPRQWDRARQKLADLPRCYKRQTGQALAPMAYVIENTGRDHHVHALVKGTVDETALGKTWGARVDVDQLYNPAGAAHYIFKATRTPDTLQAHLAINGGRVVHTSRTYYGNWTQKQTMSFVAPHSQDWKLIPK